MPMGASGTSQPPHAAASTQQPLSVGPSASRRCQRASAYSSRALSRPAAPAASSTRIRCTRASKTWLRSCSVECFDIVLASPKRSQRGNCRGEFRSAAR